MNITDAVYNQWMEDLQNKLEPPELTKAYRMFRKEMDKTTVMTSSRKDEIWEMMIYCMTVASEFSFKEGFRTGLQVIDEARR